MTEHENKRVPAVRSDEAEPNGLEAAAISLARRLVDLGIDGLGPLDSAATAAEKARATSRDVEAAIDDLVTKHTKLGAAGGFVTGVGGFVTLPLALPVNVFEFYVLATRMVAGIAHLRGYDLARDEVRAAVLLALIGTDNRSVLQKVGFRAKDKLAEVATNQLPRPAVMVINKGVGFHLLAQTGRRSLSRLGRFLPVAGGAIGAGVDWWLLRKIGAVARAEFTQRAISA